MGAAPKLEKIKDTDLRARLEEAHGHLRTNKPTDAVKTVADAFLDMLARYPQILEATAAVRMGRRMPLVMRWPMLGANLSLESVQNKSPKIEFTRDRFAMSEAITYYEFTVDTAIAQGV